MLVLARGFTVAFLLSLAGALTFRVVVAPHAFGRMTQATINRIEHYLIRWVRLCVIFAGVALCVWLAALAANLGGPATVGAEIQDIGAVVTDTSFGHIASLQVLLLISTGLVLSPRPSPSKWRVCLALGTAASIMQVVHGHAYAMTTGVSLLETAEVLHLWAAGAWLGSLLPLLLVVWLAPPAASAVAARWFTPLGKLCVVLLAVSAGWQGWVLIGSTKGLVQTAYGWVVLLKLCLFGGLLAVAMLNRYRFAPDLRGDTPDRARRRFMASLALQTGFGLLIILAAALLGQLQPGMSMPSEG